MQLPDPIDALSDRIETLQYLVGALGALSLMLCMLVMRLLVLMSRAQKLAVANLERRVFQERATELLSAGDYATLKQISEERRRERPADELALYYSAMASFRLGDLVAAKDTFLRLRRLDTSWHRKVDALVAEIEQRLKASGPKLV